MLTHLITKTTNISTKTDDFPIGPFNIRMGKYEYAQFISKVPFKRGDILINAFIMPEYIRPQAFFLVEDVQEIHHLATYELYNGVNTPQCLYVRNNSGARFWSIPNRWLLASEEAMAEHKVREELNVMLCN